LSSADILRTDRERGGSLYADVSIFWRKKFEFFEIYSVSVRTRGEGVEPVQTFYGQGGQGVNFSRFCADILYERPLILNYVVKYSNINLNSSIKNWSNISY